MPRPIPVPVRQIMFRLWQEGWNAPQIAERFGVSCPTVYRLLQRFRLDGVAGVTPGYHRSGGDLTPPEAVRAAIDVRREHPTWGAEFIRMQLLETDPAWPVPSARRCAGGLRGPTSPAPAGRRPRVKAQRAAAPHEAWQMDAKEHIIIKHNQQVSWLRLIDECSGAVLHTTVFPPREWPTSLPMPSVANSAALSHGGGCPDG